MSLMPISPEAMREIGDHMRAADREEIAAASGIGPHECLLLSVSMSGYVKVIHAEGVPLAVVGLVQTDRCGVPWMLGSEAIERYRKTFLRGCFEAFQAMKQMAPRMMNYVHAENISSLRLLARLGFTIEGSEPFGVLGENFHRFHVGAPHV